MKSLYLLFIILLAYLLIISNNIIPIYAQSIGRPVAVMPAPGYEYTGITSGKLVWPEGKSQELLLNLTLEQVPDNLSKIEIPLIIFAYIGEIAGNDRIIDQKPLNPEILLSNANKSSLINQSLGPPDVVDRFYLNISVFSRTIGNLTQAQAISHVIRFPDKDTILVDRDKLVPLINLYGFPPRTFFKKWLPIYASIGLLLLTPSIIVLGTKVKQKTSGDNKQIIDSEVNNNE